MTTEPREVCLEEPTTAGSYFISNYPPYSLWSPDRRDEAYAALDRPPRDGGADGPPHRVYNLGNSRAEDLRDFIAAIERATNRQAILVEEPMQPGDVRATWADVSAGAVAIITGPLTNAA